MATRIQCPHCDERFMVKGDSEPVVCPYCSESVSGRPAGRPGQAGAEGAARKRVSFQVCCPACGYRYEAELGACPGCGVTARTARTRQADRADEGIAPGGGALFWGVRGGSILLGMAAISMLAGICFGRVLVLPVIPAIVGVLLIVRGLLRGNAARVRRPPPLHDDAEGT
jgi:hypothetical protein